MLIDKSHRLWAVITLCATLVAGVFYALYLQLDPDAPRGGSLPGLAFGALAAALMLFCGTFPLRKKVPQLPLGSAQTWLRAHIWLGLLTLPLTLFHTGFGLGGWLEQGLMFVYSLVMVSGLAGLGFQHYMPRFLKTSVPVATMFEEIPVVLRRLRDRADDVVVRSCGSLFLTEPAPNNAAEVLRRFHLESVRPFLATSPSERHPLGRRGRAAAIFARVRLALPPESETDASQAVHETLRTLEQICTERRMLCDQHRLHWWLHGWLLIHLPLSIALLTLLVLHAASALYY